jgi:CheY-like chemotaxis protein
MLMQADIQDPKIQWSRGVIERQLRHMIRLVDDLLDVSRITLGHVNLRADHVSLKHVLEDALEAVTGSLRARGHRFLAELPDEDIPLDGDATRLSQVFQNLLDNAAKYTPEGGEIRLRALRDGNRAVVSVRDNGIGVPSGMQSRIFDMFTRAHPSDRIKSSGLGIGLALARQLVRLHEGHIEVRSEGNGRGSEFVVTLPVSQSKPMEGPVTERVSTAAKQAKQRILVVDDNRDAAESLAMILGMSGSDVDVALGGPQALEKIATFAPDIVFMDIGMPGMDGYEVAERIRAVPSCDQLVLVALTGWGQAEDRERAMKAGFDQHLTKPVDPADLDQVLRMRRDPSAREHRSPRAH